MKLQYLGDSKDAFKWDYLDFLARKMKMDLHVIPMLTPDDSKSEGSTPSLWFPASGSVEKFCGWLRKNRELEQIRRLPKCTGGDYQVRLHNPCNSTDKFFRHSKRVEYFDAVNFASCQGQMVFLDPDIGFQPAKTINEKHVKYSDMEIIWPQIHKDSIVVVFQHGRRMSVPFCEHYKEIRDGLRQCRLENFHSTALFWCDKLMFVAIGKSREQIEEVRDANVKYQRKGRPVLVIGAP